MTVSFAASNASVTYKRVPCTSPSMGLPCIEGDRCGYCDNGYEEEAESDAPEVNFSNDNARSLLALLGLPVHLDGKLLHAHIPRVLQRFMQVLNDEGCRGHLLSEPQFVAGQTTTQMVVNGDGMAEIVTTGGASSFHLGNTDEDTLDRLTRLRDVFVWASTNGSDIYWC